MRLEKCDAGFTTVRLTEAELSVLTQALNSICNGMRFTESEFHSRMGVTVDEARVVLEDIWSIRTWTQGESRNG
jgi:hypothetical protein